MRKLALLVFAALLAVACVSKDSDKLGTVAPSGPGQTTSARSHSVTIASDQLDKGFLATVPNVVTAVTKSDTTNTSAYCNRGIYVSSDAGVIANVAVVPSSVTYVDAAQAVSMQVTPGSFLPGSFQRIMSTGTGNVTITCFGAQ